MAALVAAALAQTTDRSAWLAARLGDRFEGRRAAVIAGLAAALIVVNAIAAVAARLVAPLLTPNASALLLALALVSAGGAALVRPKPPRLKDARAGALIASLAGALALGIGDRTQFITFALAARTPLPVLAAVGATLGGLAILIPAALAGERARAALPEAAIRLGAAAVLLLWGVIAALGALRLI